MLLVTAGLIQSLEDDEDWPVSDTSADLSGWE